MCLQAWVLGSSWEVEVASAWRVGSGGGGGPGLGQILQIHTCSPAPSGAAGNPGAQHSAETHTESVCVCVF